MHGDEVIENRGGRGRAICAAILFLAIFSSDIQISTGTGGVPVWVPFIFCLGAGALVMSRKLGGFIETFLIMTVLATLYNILLLITDPASLNAQSLIVSFLFILLASLVYAILISQKNPDIALGISIRWFLWVEFCIILIQVASGVRLGYVYYHYFLPITRESGIFLEPSHVAIALAPCFAIFFCDKELWNSAVGRWAALPLFSIALLCPSATLIASILFGLMLRFTRSYSRILIALVASILIVFSVSYLSGYIGTNPILIRLAGVSAGLSGGHGVSKDDNASSFIFNRGLYIAGQTLKLKPIGFGANNLPEATKHFGGSFSGSALAQALRDQNSKDGASLLIKIIGEFGWIGLLSIVVIVLVNVNYVALRSGSVGYGISLSSLAIVFVLCMRGAGYFDFGFVFCVAVTFYNFRRGAVRRRASRSI